MLALYFRRLQAKRVTLAKKIKGTLFVLPLHSVDSADRERQSIDLLLTSAHRCMLQNPRSSKVCWDAWLFKGFPSPSYWSFFQVDSKKCLGFLVTMLHKFVWACHTILSIISLHPPDIIHHTAHRLVIFLYACMMFKRLYWIKRHLHCWVYVFFLSSATSKVYVNSMAVPFLIQDRVGLECAKDGR